MKKKITFLLMLILVLLCSVCLFVGCDETPDNAGGSGNGGGTTQTPGGDASEGGGDTANNDAPITLKTTGFDENNSASLTVSGQTEIFSFADNITANNGYSYRIYLSADCADASVIDSNYDGLDYGKNYYYIKATKGADTKQYTLCVVREKYLTVTFDFGDGTENETVSVLYGDTVNPPARVPNPVGYTFKGWNFDFTKGITDDTTIGIMCQVNSYTCTLDYNYDIPDDTKTVFYDAITYLGTPTRANHRFLGWYYNGTKVESNTKWKYAEDITLVAEWEFIGTEGLTFSKIDGRDAYSVGFGTKATEASEVIIPDTYNGMPVVKMSSPMFCEFTKITLPKNLEYLPRFQYCYNLREIVIPKTVTETAHNAFSGCSSLQNITFENGGTALTLGVQIFQNCTSLSSITLPDHLTDIGLYPFDGCSSLSSINVSDNATNFKSVDGVLYSKDMKTIYAYPPAKIGTTYTLDGVSKIFDGAFDSHYLTTLNIKNFGIAFNIGNVAFSGCTQLTTINFYGTKEQLGFSQHAQVSSSITINYLG